MGKVIAERLKALIWTPLVRRFGPSHKAARSAMKEYRHLQRMLLEDTGTLAYVGMRVNYTQQRLTDLEKLLHSGSLTPKEFPCLQAPATAQPTPSAT